MNLSVLCGLVLGSISVMLFAPDVNALRPYVKQIRLA